MAKLNIPITKAKNKVIEVDTEVDLGDDDMYRLVMEEGLKVVLNRKMSKLASPKDLEGADLEKAVEAAMQVAAKNLQDLREGKLKKGRAATGTKVAGVVMTEARRLAKEIVKNELREAGIRISHVEASEITKAANALIEADPSFIEQATANIEARKSVTSKLDIKALVKESPKLVAKAEKEKAARKESLSAKQSGKTKVRSAIAAPKAKAVPSAQTGA